VHFGLAWIRRRQRSLSRAALGLFCAAWLQAAIVPCVMAHGGAPGAHPGTDSAGAHQHHDDAHAGHDHHAPPADSAAAGVSHPCIYCPPGVAGAGDCNDHGGCAYPHDPQVDARGAGAIFAAVPAPFFAPLPAAHRVVLRAEASAAAAVPRVSLSVSYCRFIE